MTMLVVLGCTDWDSQAQRAKELIGSVDIIDDDVDEEKKPLKDEIEKESFYKFCDFDNQSPV